MASSAEKLGLRTAPVLSTSGSVWAAMHGGPEDSHTPHTAVLSAAKAGSSGQSPPQAQVREAGPGVLSQGGAHLGLTLRPQPEGVLSPEADHPCPQNPASEGLMAVLSHIWKHPWSTPKDTGQQAPEKPRAGPVPPLLGPCTRLCWARAVGLAEATITVGWVSCSGNFTPVP